MKTMSNGNSPYALDEASVPVTRYVYSTGTQTHKLTGRATAVRFIRGPIPFDWMCKANALPGKAGAVGLALWFVAGVKQSNTFVVTAEAITLAGCSRQAFYRGLKALADEQLVRLSPRTGGRHSVTICR